MLKNCRPSNNKLSLTDCEAMMANLNNRDIRYISIRITENLLSPLLDKYAEKGIIDLILMRRDCSVSGRRFISMAHRTISRARLWTGFDREDFWRWNVRHVMPNSIVWRQSFWSQMCLQNVLCSFVSTLIVNFLTHQRYFVPVFTTIEQLIISDLPYSSSRWQHADMIQVSFYIY